MTGTAKKSIGKKTRKSAVSASKASPKAKAPSKSPQQARKRPSSPASATPSKGLRPQSPVPEFKIASTQSGEISLSSLRGKKVVLYFYPKDNTPGCTLEGQEFNQLYADFKKANAEVFGISRDSVKSHDNFRCKFDFKFELLSDSEEKLCKLFDVIKEKNMYGKKVLGIERSTFVIDENGKLAAEFRKIKAPGHAQEMLKFVKSMSSTRT